jgi:HD-like signal output (HDOD) protein
MADAADIRARVERIDSLPALPKVVEKLCSIVEDEHTSTADIGRLISADQVLSARVLKIVNSAFYGFPGRISTVTHTLVLLGFQVVRGLVLSAGVIDMMSQGMKGLWEHSMGCSIASGLLARHAHLPEPEEAQVAGLLHDLGKVVLSAQLRKEFEEVVAGREKGNLTFFEAEREFLGGITHCDLAAKLIEKWNLPLQLREPIIFHHNPHGAKLAPQQTAVVHVADALIRAAGVGSGGDPYVPRISPEAMEILDLKTEDLRPVIESLLLELENVDFYEFA